MKRVLLPVCLVLLLIGCDEPLAGSASEPTVVRPGERARPVWERPPSDTVHVRAHFLARHERFDRERWETFASFELRMPRALRIEAELLDREVFLASYRLSLPEGASRLDLRFRYDPDDRSLDQEDAPAHVFVYRIEVDGTRQAEGRFAWFGTLPLRWQPVLPASPAQGFWAWPRGRRQTVCHFFWFGSEDPHDVALVGEDRIRVGVSEHALVSHPRPVWVFQLRF